MWTLVYAGYPLYIQHILNVKTMCTVVDRLFSDVTIFKYLGINSLYLVLVLMWTLLEFAPDKRNFC